MLALQVISCTCLLIVFSVSFASAQRLGSPATDPGDRIAISSVQAALFSSQLDAEIALNWQNNSDPCGYPTCVDCAWTGISCRSGRIIIINLPSYVGGPLPQGTLSAALGQLRALQSLELPGRQLQGTLPAEIGRLPLQRLNLANNALTGPLPPAWGNLTGLRSMDLANNKLMGAYPTEWARLSIAPNISGNPVCLNTTLSRSAGVNCSPAAQLTAQQGSTSLPPPPPPPPYGTIGSTGFSTFGSFQMSTGINIAVSVVIASALLIALAAGYLRIRRQQQAHRAYLETRTRVLRLADTDMYPSSNGRAAPPSGGDPSVAGGGAPDMPFLVLAPDGREIFIARKEVPGAPSVGKDDSSAPTAAEASGSATTAQTGVASGGPASAQPSGALANGPAGNAVQDNGRELTTSWLRRWGAVDRVWAEHVAASLNAELDARRRTRRRPLPLYIATLQRRASDPSAMDFMVHADEPAVAAQTAPAVAPAPPPPRFAWLGRIGRMRRTQAPHQQTAGAGNTGPPPASQPHQVAVSVSAQQPLQQPQPQQQQPQQQAQRPASDVNAMV